MSNPLKKGNEGGDPDKYLQKADSQPADAKIARARVANKPEQKEASSGNNTKQMTTRSQSLEKSRAVKSKNSLSDSSDFITAATGMNFKYVEANIPPTMAMQCTMHFKNFVKGMETEDVESDQRFVDNLIKFMLFILVIVVLVYELEGSQRSQAQKRKDELRNARLKELHKQNRQRAVHLVAKIWPQHTI
jgi:hypothetical protein